MRYALAVLATLAMSVAAPAEAQFSAPMPSHEDYHVELGGAFWTPTPDAVMRFNAAGPDIDLIGLYEIDKERFTDFRAVVKPARKHKIRVQKVDVSYEKETTFTSGPSRADFKWDLWRVGYEWDVVSGAGGFLGPIAELKYAHLVTNIGRTPTSAPVSADHKSPLLAIGGAARGYISENVSLTAEGTRSLLFRGGGEHADFVDYDVYGTVNLGRNFAVQAGYRSMTLDYLIDDDEGELKMKGPYWGGTIRF